MTTEKSDHNISAAPQLPPLPATATPEQRKARQKAAQEVARQRWREKPLREKIKVYLILAFLFLPGTLTLLIGIAAVIMPVSLDRFAARAEPVSAMLVDWLEKPVVRGVSVSTGGLNPRSTIPTERLNIDDLAIASNMAASALMVLYSLWVLGNAALKPRKTPMRPETRNAMRMPATGAAGLIIFAMGLFIAYQISYSGDFIWSSETAWDGGLHSLPYFLLRTGQLTASIGICLALGGALLIAGFKADREANQDQSGKPAA